MKYILIAAVFATIYGYPYGPEILAAFVSMFCLFYYWLAFKLAAGLNRSNLIMAEIDEMQSITLSVLANLTAVATLIIQTPYAFIGYIALPWIALSMSTMTMAWLIYFKFVEINAVEPEDND